MDMWAGEILLTMKEKSEFSEIKLTMALPFEGYDVDWDRASRERKNKIQKQAEILVIGKESGSSSYTKRNHFMVDHADIILAVYDNERKKRSGIPLTVNYAERKKYKRENCSSIQRLMRLQSVLFSLYLKRKREGRQPVIAHMSLAITMIPPILLFSSIITNMVIAAQLCSLNLLCHSG